ncbi:MAG: CHASE domain-containing protein [Proteobacteria bacterium]|nr:CHASE domain-containing protein [Pseudomonadota bacterium]
METGLSAQPPETGEESLQAIKKSFFERLLTDPVYAVYGPIHRFFTSPLTKPSWIVYLGFCLTFGASLLVLSYTSYTHKIRLETDFGHDVRHFSLALEERVARYTNVLQATASLLGEKDHDIGWSRWYSYVMSVINPRLFPGFWELSYIEAVAPNQLDSVMKSLSSEMTRDIKIYPQTLDNIYYILKYVCPTLNRKSALEGLFAGQGFNVATNEASKEALEKARDTGQAVATPPLFLVTDPDKTRLTVILYYPVYDLERMPRNVEERKKYLKGWVSAPIDALNFFEHLAPQGFKMNVSDTGQNLYKSPDNDKSVTDLTHTQTYNIWGRPWLITLAVQAKALNPFYRLSLILIPFIGLLFSCAMAYILWSQQTTQRRAEALAEAMSADLRASEHKNRTLLENVPGAIFRCSQDVNWRFEYVSDAIEHITGYGADVFTAQQLSYADLLFEVDLGLVEQTVGLVPVPGHSYDVEYRIHHKSGGLRWVSERGRVVSDPESETHFLTGTLFDVTERKRREADVRSLTTALQNAVEGILFIDRDYTCRTVNDAYASLFETTADQLVGMSWLETFSEDDQERIASACRASDPNERISIDLKGILHNEEGHLYLHVVMIAALDGDGDVEGYYCFVRDVTQRIKEEEALASAVEEAKQANKTKSEFLATMSHELRTPLNAIIGYSEMLLEEVEDFKNEMISGDLKKINGAGRHLLELINDILDVSKLEAGKTTYHFEEFDVRKMAQDIYDLMLPSAGKNSNQITLECPDDIGMMYSDYTKVRQGLFNLMSNAVKFTKEGTVTLRVATQTLGRREMLSFSVQDTGCGITPEQLKKLFQPFTQADSSTTRQYGGTGLGLTITKRFCEELGGSVDVTSEKDVGSTFSILLPRIASSALIERLTKKEDEKAPQVKRSA